MRSSLGTEFHDLVSFIKILPEFRTRFCIIIQHLGQCHRFAVGGMRGNRAWPRIEPRPNQPWPVVTVQGNSLLTLPRWLFGKDKQEPVVSDSRQVDDFGKILESEAAVEYLERTESPSFSVARRMAGVAESEVAAHVERAADEVEEALKAAHQHRTSRRLQVAVKRLGADTAQLLEVFPAIRKQLDEERQ